MTIGNYFGLYLSIQRNMHGFLVEGHIWCPLYCCTPCPCIPFSRILIIFTAATKGLGSFSDKFTPQELCDWLGTIFKEKGLELREEQRHIFISKFDNPGWHALSDT